MGKMCKIGEFLVLMNVPLVFEFVFVAFGEGDAEVALGVDKVVLKRVEAALVKAVRHILTHGEIRQFILLDSCIQHGQHGLTQIDRVQL